ncbi:MAG TPA: LuxR C-terminal-related transcriptional regulator, partial [Herpetosiphonaceae bacterium]|nr:LuxR C-terminal-related transcriptional regulator [Herpetosiphonaceae bacterium]
GGQRYILDYLGDEVLRRQPTQIRRFLLDTAILDRFSPALCEAVTEERDAHAILALLERANMFLVPLDDERQWYRYHRLFTDMLRAQLGREEPERARLLHARAAEWYERQGAPAEAMQHATAAEEWERVAQLVERFGGPMLASGEWATLLRWIDRLPDAFVRQRPQIGLFYAWALVLTGQWQTIEGRLHDVERCLGDSGWDGTATGEHSPLNAWRGQVAAIRGYLAAQQGDSGRAIQHSRLALVLLPEDDPIMRGVIALSLGTIYLSLGNVDESGRFLIEARTASQAGGNLATVLSANGALAQVYEEQGELRRAATIYRGMIRLAPAPLPMLLHAHLRLGTIMYEWNDLGGAQEHLEQAMALARQFGAPELFALAALGLARLHYALGDVAAAGELVQQGEDRGRSVRQSLAGGYIAAHVARLRLLLREQEAALRWAEADADAGAGEQGLVGEMIELTLARVQLAYGAAGQALKRIEPLLRVAEAQGRTGRVVEMLVLQALALDGLQDQATAMAVLQRAVTLAEAHGYVRTFIDEGEPMRALLERAGKRRSVPRYAGVLVLAAERQGSRGAAPSTAIAEIFLPQDDDDADTSTHPALVEPLSEREREVLRLLAAGRSNRDVAEALIVATGTIKKHINNIYGKLGVHSRTQAIARARELNLL